MRVHDVAYSPDGSIVASASYDMTVAIWDSETGVESGRLQGHGGSVTSLAFSCDGKKIVTGSVDLSLKLWDVPTLKEITAVPDHPGHVTCVAASPDGKHLCSGSHLGLIQVGAVGVVGSRLTTTFPLRCDSRLVWVSLTLSTSLLR